MNVKDNLTFSKALERLEEIIRILESTDVQLEEGIKLLEEGVKLHQYCRNQLDDAQLRITKLLKQDNDNNEQIKE